MAPNPPLAAASLPKRPRASRAQARAVLARRGRRREAARFTGQVLIAMPTMGDPRFAQA